MGRADAVKCKAAQGGDPTRLRLCRLLSPPYPLSLSTGRRAGMEPRLLDHPVIIAIAQRVRKTAAQLLLAWAVQRGTAFLPTSLTPARIIFESIV